MKKTLFALFAVVFVVSICFADEVSVTSGMDKGSNPNQAPGSSLASTQASSGNTTPTPTQLPGSANSPAPAATTAFTGKVDSILNGMNGMNPQITVKDDKGQETTFVVANDATIIGKDGSATSLDWISKDDKVAMEYTTDQSGAKIVKSIKASSDW